LNRKELQALSRIRLREARALARLGMNDGAYYLAGYSVECALKACIAKMTQRHDFPDKRKAEDSYTHSLKKLLKVAELEESRAEEARRDAAFRDNWDRVQWWSEQSRYSTTSAEKARRFLEAVSDRKHGVLWWLKRYW
jgi:HEPN domain-containing protein